MNSPKCGYPAAVSYASAPQPWHPRSPRFERRIRKVGAPLGIIIALGTVAGAIPALLTAVNPVGTAIGFVLSSAAMKGPGSRAAGIAMAYKLIDAAQARRRSVDAPHLVVRSVPGAVFHKGKLLERPVDITPTEPTESTETEVA